MDLIGQKRDLTSKYLKKMKNIKKKKNMIVGVTCKHTTTGKTSHTVINNKHYKQTPVCPGTFAKCGGSLLEIGLSKILVYTD